MPPAWTGVEYLLAVQIDWMNDWMWANADPRKRGRRPKPLRRPGQPGQNGRMGEGGRIEVMAVTPDVLEEFMNRRYKDSGTGEGPAPDGPG